MPKGVRIAKPTFSVNDDGQDLYVDSITPLFKVKTLATGAMVSDGVSFTATWDGLYKGTSDGAGTYTLLIPHNLGYLPMFWVYCDLLNNDQRTYITTSVSGVGTAGDVTATATVDTANVTLIIRSKNYDGIGGLDAARAGAYGYTIYVFYDSLENLNG